MASKVLAPAAPAPFTKLQVKKSPEPAGFIISGDPAARVTHLEHSVRFLQEQHRLMLSGLHAEIEALRERNRDLQFQLIFNKESSPKPTSPTVEENVENNEETKLKREVSQLEKAVSSARCDARDAEARVAELQRLLDAQSEKIRQLELQTKCETCEANAAAPASVPAAAPVAVPVAVAAAAPAAAATAEDSVESRAELRARLADAEKLVRRLRSEAERRRRELQCMKNSVHASLRATGLDAYGFQNNYHFPAVGVHHTPDFWRDPITEEFSVSRGRSTRRPLTLPELSGHQIHRSTVYANNHTTRPRANGYENKNKKPQQSTNEVTGGKSSEQEQSESRLEPNYSNILPNIINVCNMEPDATFPELKIVVTKMIPHGNVSTACAGGVAGASEGRARARRPARKHIPTADHT